MKNVTKHCSQVVNCLGGGVSHPHHALLQAGAGAKVEKFSHWFEMRDLFSRTLAPFATTFSEFPLLSISPRCATIFSQPLPLEHAELKHQCPMEPWLRSEFAIDCQGTALLINYQQCVRRRTKKYIFCIANKATFCKLITLQTCIVQFYKYLFLQTWHFPVLAVLSP